MRFDRNWRAVEGIRGIGTPLIFCVTVFGGGANCCVHEQTECARAHGVRKTAPHFAVVDSRPTWQIETRGVLVADAFERKMENL